MRLWRKERFRGEVPGRIYDSSGLSVMLLLVRLSFAALSPYLLSPASFPISALFFVLYTYVLCQCVVVSARVSIPRESKSVCSFICTLVPYRFASAWEGRMRTGFLIFVGHYRSQSPIEKLRDRHLYGAPREDQPSFLPSLHFRPTPRH